MLAYAAVFIVGICISPLLLFPPTADNSQNLKDIYGTIGIEDYENLTIGHSQKVDQYGIAGSVDMKELSLENSSAFLVFIPFSDKIR